MTPDEYVLAILQKRAPATIPPGSLDLLWTAVRTWAGTHLLDLKLSGSSVKGTAVAGSSDIDVLVSLSNSVYSSSVSTLPQIYNSLNDYLIWAKYPTRLQNVSIGVKFNGINIDLVPGVKHPGNTTDHSLHKRKAKTWTKTNIDTHINQVRDSGRTADIRAIKIWRNVHNLDISSFYLELVVLEALRGKPLYAPSANFLHVLDFLGSKFPQLTVMDPANTANTISDELTVAEKQAIAQAATTSRGQPYMDQIIW